MLPLFSPGPRHLLVGSHLFVEEEAEGKWENWNSIILNTAVLGLRSIEKILEFWLLFASFLRNTAAYLLKAIFQIF